LTTLKPYVKKLAAHVFQIDNNNRIKIAYPIELFEKLNMPNILSSIAGNVFGLRTIRNLRLNDVHLPKRLVKSFRGPKYGTTGIRNLLKVHNRPLVGTIIKPKLGLKTPDHAQIAYNAWIGGCDIVKDDENLSNQNFNSFNDRVLSTLEMRDRAETETGEKKVYMANITSETFEMIKRAEYILDHGGRYMMIDILTCGFSALQTLREQDLDLVIHAHRAGHASFTKNSRHGISMQVIAKVSRVIGVDQLHVGTIVGKMSETKEEVMQNCEAVTSKSIDVKKVLPVASGGLYPSLVPALMKYFGTDFVIQAGGGIHGHTYGTIAGAKAMRQSVDASLKDISLKEYAKTHKELEEALNLWT
jgi:ribulose-bisphosphate carboxylase large chain